MEKISKILQIGLYLMSFTLIATPRVTACLWKGRVRDMQNALDEEHGSGRGVCFFDKSTKNYPPFTAQDVWN